LVDHLNRQRLRWQDNVILDQLYKKMTGREKRYGSEWPMEGHHPESELVQLRKEIAPLFNAIERIILQNHSAMEALAREILAQGPWQWGKIARLEEYYDGKSLLRFRRSKKVNQERDGWKLCVCALARLKDPYDLFAAVKMWVKVYLFGSGFYNHKRGQSTSDAAVCSTLYADAHNEALGTNLGQRSGVCVPATLSGSDEFVDIDVSWLKIA
jgi:hypothetical protein